MSTLASECVQFSEVRLGWGWGMDGRRDSLRQAPGWRSRDVGSDSDGGLGHGVQFLAALVRWDPSVQTGSRLKTPE